MTKTEFLRKVADNTGMKSKKDVELIWEEFLKVALRELKLNGSVVLPGLAKLKIHKVAARPAGTYHILGQDRVLPFKPASKKVKALILKVFKDAV